MRGAETTKTRMLPSGSWMVIFFGLGEKDTEDAQPRGGFVEVVDGEDHAEGGVGSVGDEGDRLGGEAGELEPESGA